MSHLFGDKITLGNVLPPPGDYRAGAFFFDYSTATYYWHNGADWVAVGGDPTVSNFDTYADLRAAHTPGSPIILVGGRASAGDGGQGFFIQDPSGRSDNDGTILVDADGQSWQRVFTGDVLAVWFFGNGVTVGASDVTNLYDRVLADHGLYTIDWYGTTLVTNSPSTVNVDFSRPTIVKRLRAMPATGQLAFRAVAPTTADPTYVEIMDSEFRLGSGVRFATTSDDAVMYVHDAIFDRGRLFLRGRAIFADSVGLNARVDATDESVVRNIAVRNDRYSGPHAFSGNALVTNSRFTYIFPPTAGVANIGDAARVIGNTFWADVNGVASGTVSLSNVDGALFINNRVYLRRHTYPYPFSLNNARSAVIAGNYVESHTLGGQDSTQWTYGVDADSIIIANNVWLVRGAHGNYGVRIRGGHKANTLVTGNMFMNLGSVGGHGIERRDGTGNLKFVGNVFYNWGYAIRRIGGTPINGVFEGNSNAFSSCGPINDPDYVNTSSDTTW